MARELFVSLHGGVRTNHSKVFSHMILEFEIWEVDWARIVLSHELEHRRIEIKSEKGRKSYLGDCYRWHHDWITTSCSMAMSQPPFPLCGMGSRHEINDVIALWTYMSCSVHMVSCADTGCIHQVWWRSEPQVCSPWSWLAGAGEGGEGGRENGSEGGVVSYKYLLSLATGTASLVSKPYENTRLLQTSRVTCSSTGSAGRVQLHSRRHI